MAKEKTTFFCKECGYESPKWLGQCPGCKSWDSFVEAPTAGGKGKRNAGSRNPLIDSPKPERISEISREVEERTQTGIGELDRVLGGGIVRGSLVLVGGDPGIGKSTLLLMMCGKLAAAGREVLYVSGEESPQQIRMRADRLSASVGGFNDHLKLLAETNLDLIVETMEKENPEFVIIDSIQTMFRDEIGSVPGSVSQVRECTSVLLKEGKSRGISIFIVGHVTKEGTVAGPRMLEHMVDTVLYFEGDAQAAYRILRSVKNRFGSTNEIGVFEMRGDGLKEILNPSEYMLQGKPEGESGSVVACSIEGTRPILVEVQALICQTSFQMPRRTAAGIDYNRVNLLMAVLEKRLSLPLYNYDAYVNVAGGMKIGEPAMDLAIVMAILSSYYNKEIDEKTIAFGEVGLTGEIRAVTQAEARVAEAEKLGFARVILPGSTADFIRRQGKAQIELVGVSHLRDVAEWIR